MKKLHDRDAAVLHGVSDEDLAFSAISSLGISGPVPLPVDAVLSKADPLWNCGTEPASRELPGVACPERTDAGHDDLSLRREDHDLVVVAGTKRVEVCTIVGLQLSGCEAGRGLLVHAVSVPQTPPPWACSATRLMSAINGSMVTRMLSLILGLTACMPRTSGDTSNDTALPTQLPPPWADWTAVPLAGLQPLLTVDLPQATSPTTIETIPDRSLSIVWDPGASAAWVLDARYRHSPAPTCVPLGEWPELDNSNQRGCQSGQIHTQRGALRLPEGIAHVAVDPHSRRVALLAESGAVWLASADVLGGNPLDHLRPLRTPVTIDASRLFFGADGELLASAGAEVLRLNLESGSTDAIATFSATVTGLLEQGGVLWTQTTDGLYRAGKRLADSAGISGLVPIRDGGVAYTDLERGEVVYVAANGAVSGREAVTGLLGPIAQDTESGRLYVVTDGGLVVPGSELAHAGTFTDVAVNAAHEVLALGSDRVTVLGDDDLLADLTPSEPVGLMVAAFVEKPRSTDHDAVCQGPSSVSEFAGRAGSNATVLSDLPAAVALGLTPHFARRAQECGVTDMVAPLLRLPRAAVGALYHEQHDCSASDTSCIADFLSSEADEITSLGAALAFSSGLSTQEGDWVTALADAGAPPAYLFFGLSIRSDVSAQGDPRAKDAWPLSGRSATWQADGVSDIEARGERGWMTLLPGNNLPAFNLSACANLFLRECHLGGGGDGTRLDSEDMAVLAVLARRAVAEQNGLSAWSFHLPDLGVYDYTDGCTRDGRIWSGDRCAAARLQEWSKSVHTRYVANGLAQWVRPDELELP